MINKYAEISERVLLYNAMKGILRVKEAGHRRGRAFAGIPDDFRKLVNTYPIDALEEFMAEPSEGDTAQMRRFVQNRLNYLRQNPDKAPQAIPVDRTPVVVAPSAAPKRVAPVVEPDPAKVQRAKTRVNLAALAQGEQPERLGQRLNIGELIAQSNGSAGAQQKPAPKKKEQVRFDPANVTFDNIGWMRNRAIRKLLREHPEYKGKSEDELWNIAQRAVVIDNPASGSATITNVSKPTDTTAAGGGAPPTPPSPPTPLDDSKPDNSTKPGKSSITAAGLGMTAGGALLGGGIGYGTSRGLGLYNDDASTGKRMLGHALTAGGAVGGGIGGYYLGKHLGY